ncbi:hypothetical protein BVC71_01325 [Marivivens niveibacter]|uniref:Flagellar FliJ protein n=1 Tax=Marivivens niveibacter TaxID=1930667 RepID=A0A251X0S4_9RHOB|nr:hypothetical protein [Marivivens niveibacter]OUD10186.1 hypothetical protein BVC71_01325 [Marivivens niveibacter]
MRNRSDLYTLMAKKEAATKAEKMRELRNITAAHNQAEMLSERLRTILDERQVKGPVLAAQLRSASSLNTKIAAEAAVQSERKVELSKKLEQSRTEFARQDYKTQYLVNAAAQARAEEEDEREAREMASRPVPRR